MAESLVIDVSDKENSVPHTPRAAVKGLKGRT
jgi:hypothetical protein